MPKGRGSNEARRNRRLAGRHGGGTQSGSLLYHMPYTAPDVRSPSRGKWWRAITKRRDLAIAKATLRRAERPPRRAHHKEAHHRKT